MNTKLRTELAGVVRALDARDRQLRDEIRDALERSGDQRYIELAGQVHDLGDEAVANELIAVESTLIERHMRELREIESARERFVQGSINVCSECGGEIGVRRLQANPAAVRCIACQDHFDRTHAHGATLRL